MAGTYHLLFVCLSANVLQWISPSSVVQGDEIWQDMRSRSSPILVNFGPGISPRGIGMWGYTPVGITGVLLKIIGYR